MKKVLVTALLSAFALMITGCSAYKPETMKSEKSIDKTININNAIPQKILDKNLQPIKATSHASFKAPEDPNIQSLYEHDEIKHIVYGTVKDLKYIDNNALPQTVYTLEIEDVFRGNLKPGYSISVVEGGGYVRMSKFIEVYGDAHFPDMPQEQRENGILIRKLDGIPLTNVGEKHLLFLCEPNKTGEENEGAYSAYKGFVGKYVMQDDGKIKRYEPNEGFYEYSLSDKSQAEKPMTIEKAGEILENLNK